MLVVKNSILVAYDFNVNLKMIEPYKKYLNVARLKNIFFCFSSKYVVTQQTVTWLFIDFGICAMTKKWKKGKWSEKGN